ncbi:MAG: hypothetical protein IT461_12365 [Planctomycetes bacterium]|jgi:hypothetical protein|nr:hypothetical protein [Planctomycetota bacterium]
MLWLRALAVWALIMVVETVHGIVRTLWITPVLGDLGSRQAALPVAAALILLITLLTSRWLKARSIGVQLCVGGLWAALTLGFEFGLGVLLGYSMERVSQDYNPMQGGFMAFGLAFMALCPLLASRLARSREHGALQRPQ